MTDSEFHEVCQCSDVRSVRVDVREGAIRFEYMDANEVLRVFNVTGGELSTTFADTRVRKLIGDGVYI